MAPTRAGADCTSVHSALLGPQMPTRSPLRMPAPTSPRATASTSACSSAQVQRRPLAHSTSASRSAYDATVRARLSQMVSSSSAGVDPPFVQESVLLAMLPNLARESRSGQQQLVEPASDDEQADDAHHDEVDHRDGRLQGDDAGRELAAEHDPAVERGGLDDPAQHPVAERLDREEGGR